MKTTTTTPEVLEAVQNKFDELIDDLSADGTQWENKSAPKDMNALGMRRDAVESYIEKYGDSENENVIEKVEAAQEYLDQIEEMLDVMEEEEEEQEEEEEVPDCSPAGEPDITPTKRVISDKSGANQSPSHDSCGRGGG